MKPLSLIRAGVIALAVFLALTSAPYAKAAPGGCGSQYTPYLTAIRYEQLTVSSTALPFTASVYGTNGATPMLAVVSVVSFGIVSRDDGLVPTASVGMPWAAASSFSVCGEANIKAFRMIRATSDATVNVTYYKESN